MKERRRPNLIRIAGLVGMNASVTPEEIQVSRNKANPFDPKATTFSDPLKDGLRHPIVNQHLVDQIGKVRRADRSRVRKHEKISPHTLRRNDDWQQCSYEKRVIVENQRFLRNVLTRQTT